MKLAAYTHKKAKIEIIPLIDVVFFLLATFVMVSLSMTRNQGMQVQLPQAGTSAKLDQAEQAVSLTVMETGEVFWNKEKIAASQLPYRLQSYKASSKDPRIVLNAAANADFRLVVSVLDETRKLGITKVAISTSAK